MNRRSFFKFLPVAPAALMVEGAQAAAACDKPRDGEITLSISGTREPRVKRDPHSLSFSFAETDPNKHVSMAVGEDGNLWLKTIKGEWKRVVTE